MSPSLYQARRRFDMTARYSVNQLFISHLYIKVTYIQYNNLYEKSNKDQGYITLRRYIQYGVISFVTKRGRYNGYFSRRKMTPVTLLHQAVQRPMSLSTKKCMDSLNYYAVIFLNYGVNQLQNKNRKHKEVKCGGSRTLPLYKVQYHQNDETFSLFIQCLL